MKLLRFIVLLLLPVAAVAQQTWTFAVSGDSRNCGDIVMPAIAASASQSQAQFFWHLGDFRAIYDFDQDLLAAAQLEKKSLNIAQYQSIAWPDFIQNQLDPFRPVPVYLVIGNHELILGRSRADYVVQFADWLNRPEIQAQRLKDDPSDHKVKTYYHWQRGGVDFISLDNADDSEIDAAQLKWLEAILKRAGADPAIKTVVVGMHAALPDSILPDHSMGDSEPGISSGRKVYGDLVALRRDTGKQVYLLSSHTHFLMEGIFHTAAHVRDHTELAAWVVGTGGAHRYKLPPDVSRAKQARTNVYGYVLARVGDAGMIDFKFVELDEASVPAAVRAKYGEAQVHDCWIGNTDELGK